MKPFETKRKIKRQRPNQFYVFSKQGGVEMIPASALTSNPHNDIQDLPAHIPATENTYYTHICCSLWCTSVFCFSLYFFLAKNMISIIWYLLTLLWIPISCSNFLINYKYQLTSLYYIEFSTSGNLPYVAKFPHDFQCHKISHNAEDKKTKQNNFWLSPCWGGCFSKTLWNYM